MKFVFDQMLGIDGVWGPETQAAERAIRDQLSLGSFLDLSNWMAFLEATIDIALDRETELFREDWVA